MVFSFPKYLSQQYGGLLKNWEILTKTPNSITEFHHITNFATPEEADGKHIIIPIFITHTEINPPFPIVRFPSKIWGQIITDVYNLNGDDNYSDNCHNNRGNNRGNGNSHDCRGDDYAVGKAKLPHNERISETMEEVKICLTFFSNKGNYLAKKYKRGLGFIIKGKAEFNAASCQINIMHPTESTAITDGGNHEQNMQNIFKQLKQMPCFMANYAGKLNHRLVKNAYKATQTILIKQANSQAKTASSTTNNSSNIEAINKNGDNIDKSDNGDKQEAYHYKKLLKHILQAISILHFLTDVGEYPTGVQGKSLQEFGCNSPQYILAIKQLKIAEANCFKEYQQILKQKWKKYQAKKIAPKNTLKNAVIANLPFRLTESQDEALQEIESDLQSNQRMIRMLQGDVGSGKTITALLAGLAVVENNLQMAIMAPTEVLARQHYATISKFVANIADGKIMPCLLTASIKAQTRKATLLAIKSGKANIVIGTHAIFQNAVEFHNLAFIVIDEQHRFGVKQRVKLSIKGKEELTLQNGTKKKIRPHVLMMSATPIPRTIEHTNYGDIDISSIRQKPIGRKDIITSIMAISSLEKLIARLQIAVENGKQIYWVCPLIGKTMNAIDDTEDADNIDNIDNIYHTKDADDKGDKGDGLARNSAKQMATKSLMKSCIESSILNRFAYLQSHFAKGSIQILHGEMNTEEKIEAITNFKNGEAKILLATTIVEVGVDVPNASIIVIENATAFGLASLHQLRGRVGRGQEQSYCILLYEDEKPLEETAKARLLAIKNSNDGFEIAEQDLLLRGGGENESQQQSGFRKFSFLKLPEDGNLMNSEQDLAEI